jgi:hypothetical protein
MKKIGILFLISLFISFYGCTKEEQSIEDKNDDAVAINKNINDLTAIIASAVGKNSDLRKAIQSQVALKFDYDYDALLISFLDMDIAGEKFEDILSKNSNGKYSAKQIEKIIEESGYLQISIPVHFESFNPEKDIPLVVAIPVNIDEKTVEDFNAYDKNGNITKISAKNKPDFAVFVINQSERVDNNGLVTVDPNGFYLPENLRIHFTEAINEARENFNLKSAGNRNSIIDIVSNEEYKATLTKFGKKEDLNETTSIDNSFKSTLADPVFFAEPLAANAIDLEWNTYPNANRFLIYRSGNVNVGGVKTYKADLLIATLTNSYTMTDLVNYSNEEYKYYMKYYNGTTFLAQSNSMSVHSSHRKNNGLEYLSRVVASEQMVRILEGWWVSELEIRVQIVYKNYTGAVAQNPVVGFDIPTHGKGRLRDVNWTGQKNLFRWDRQGYDYGAYSVVLEEVDKSDNNNDKQNLWMSWVRFAVNATNNNEYKEVAEQVLYTATVLDLPDYIGSLNIKWWDPDNTLWEINPTGFSIIINHSTTL